MKTPVDKPMFQTSVIIPWCDRPELGVSLKTNETIFASNGAEVLVVNYGGSETMLADLLSAMTEPLTVLHVRAEEFNKCAAINLANTG